jgi:hypothetical protein
VLLGPVSFLLLGKAYDEVSPISLLDKVLPVYEQVLAALKEAGAQWIQVDEPILVLDLPKNTAAAYATAFQRLAESGLKILLTTYFGALGSNLDIASSLPVQGLHVDLHRAPAQLNDVLAKWPKDRVLSLGLVDGRNIWKTNLKKAAETLATVVKARGSENVFVGPSCSLLHSPVDLDAETKLDDEFKGYLIPLKKIYIKKNYTALFREIFYKNIISHILLNFHMNTRLKTFQTVLNNIKLIPKKLDIIVVLIIIFITPSFILKFIKGVKILRSKLNMQ